MLTTDFIRFDSGDRDPEVVQVDVAFLTYADQSENTANIRLDSVSYVTVAELIAHEATRRQRKRDTEKNAYKHFKWYINVLKGLGAAAGAGKKMKIVHWSIASRNIRAFLIKSEFFPAISIIVAPTKEHWYAAYPTSAGGRSKYGTRDRPNSIAVDPPPTYIKCREDYCANNCGLCRSHPKSSVCLCALRSQAIPEDAAAEEEGIP